MDPELPNSQTTISKDRRQCRLHDHPQHAFPTKVCSQPPTILLYTYDCVAKFPSNSIYKFADNTTAVVQISNIDETEFRNEGDNLVNWCGKHNLSLNVNKTKEIVILQKA